MAKIRESQPVAPVLPARKGQPIRQGQPRLQDQQAREDQPQQDRDAGDGHRLDEYA